MRIDTISRRLARTVAAIAFAVVAGTGAAGAPPAEAIRESAALSPGPDRALGPKLDPFLRRLIRDSERRSSLAWALPSQGADPLIRTELLPGGDLAAAVLVRTTDASRTRTEIAGLGGTVRVEAGDVVVGVLPVSALEVLAGRGETVSVEASRVRKPNLDLARPASKTDLVHAGTGLAAPRTGAGVVVGIVDTGIAYQHEDFRSSAGTRLHSIWDMTGVPSGSSTPVICSPADINGGTCPERDLNGHGSHVAGIAAGNGRAQSGFIGIAPEAEIIAAKATRSTTANGGFSDDDVIAACSYVFQQAQAAGKPAVVNLSLGANGGPLDGTSAYERALSNLTGPGKIIVAANGNQGSDRIHLSYAVSGSDFGTASETVWVMPQPAAMAVADFWYASGSISVGVAFRQTEDGAPLAFSQPVGPGQSVGATELRDPASGTLLATYEIDATETSNPNNGARRVLVGLTPAVAGVFSLYAHGSGTFDAWAQRGSSFGSKNGGTWKAGDFEKTVGTPASALKVIAVGNYTTKTQWTDVNGQVVDMSVNGFTIGQIAASSSRGPTRDGRTKPDLSAPGAFIAAALSPEAIPAQSADSRMQGGQLLVINGTSMASPHVAGVVALMLQANAALTYDQVIQTLQSTATKDANTGSTANNTWGAGKVDAFEAVKAVGGGSPSTTCTADATTLCLGPAGRFKVQAAYRDYGGNAGDGKAQKLTDNSGYFYFFDPTNVELVAKFVSFCNGSSGNWAIYASGLTDVEVTFKVTDTSGGLYKEYKNTLGNRFCTIGDGPFSCP